MLAVKIKGVDISFKSTCHERLISCVRQLPFFKQSQNKRTKCKNNKKKVQRKMKESKERRNKLTNSHTEI